MQEAIDEVIERDAFEKLDLTSKAPPPTKTTITNFRLLSLPAELLGYVIDCVNGFEDDTMYYIVDRRQGPPGFDEPAIRNIHRLRLVCKALCDAASRVFMPYLRIHLSEASLARAEEIIRHPRVTQNVRGIELVLDDRADNIARDFRAFFQLKVVELSYLECDWEDMKLEYAINDYEDWTPKQLDEEANRLFNTEIRNLKFKECRGHLTLLQYNVLALERWATIYDAWLEELEQTEDIYKQDDPKRRILREGFRRFQEKHAEQRQLVTSGRFKSRVLTICSRFANFQRLIFSDKDHDKRRSDDQWTNLKARTLFDDDQMLTYLTKAIPWSRSLTSDGTEPIMYPHITASRLIWDIPEALYESGIKLRALNLQCFPIQENYATGTSDQAIAYPENALAHVERFYFGLHEDLPKAYSRPRWERDLPYFLGQPQPHLVEYLARCLTNPNMRRLKILLTSCGRIGRRTPSQKKWMHADKEVLIELEETNAAVTQHDFLFLSAPITITMPLLQRLREMA